MNKIALILSDERYRAELKRVLTSGGYTVSSNPFIADLSGFLKEYRPDLVIIDGKYFDAAAAEMQRSGARMPVLAWMHERDAHLAVRFISNGAFDCLCPPVRYYEVLSIIRHVLNQTVRRDTPIPLPRKTRVPWYAAAALAAALAGFLLFNAVERSRAGRTSTFLLPFQNPTGIFWKEKTVWISDWYTQNVYHYRTGGELKLMKAYTFPDLNANTVAVTKDFLWLSGTDSYLRCYKIVDGSPVLVSKFKAPGFSPSGICFQGQYIWTTDAETNKIYQHLESSPEQVIAAYNYPGLMPVGIYWDGKNFWTADAKGNRIYRHAGPGRFFQVQKSFVLTPEGGGMMAGLSGDGRNLWIIYAGQPAKVLRYPVKLAEQK